MRHKHYDVIVAAAEGKTVQVKDFEGNWTNYSGERAFKMLTWTDDVEYRIKPEIPKSLLTDEELKEIFYGTNDSATPALRRIADAAIAHAVESGQLILKENE